MEEGVNQLITKLCELQLGSHRKPRVSQPKVSRQQKQQRLWKKSWDVLFMFQNGPHREEISVKKKKWALNEIDNAYAIAYDLRAQRKFDEANSLESLVGEYTSEGHDETKKSVLRLLISLSNTQEDTKGKMVGHGPLNLPIVFPQKNDQAILPEGPLCYKDTRIQRADDLFYTHFPSGLFEVSGVKYDGGSDAQYDFLNMDVFSAKPGTGLCGNGVFDVKGNLEDNYEKQLKHTLFGALTFSKTYSMDIHLDIPDINDTWNSHILDLKLPKMNDVSEDEGFVDRTPSIEDSMTPSSTSLEISGIEEEEKDLWELALEHIPSRHYTWERRGMPPMVLEKPFLTESGPNGFDYLYQAYQRRLKLLDPALEVSRVRVIPMRTLVEDIFNMLVGIPSETFHLQNTNFSITEGTTISGLSPASVDTLLAELMKCGSQYVRLVEFSKPANFDFHHSSGLVFQAFTVGIRKYLQHYRACVLSIPKTKTMLQVSSLMDKLREQIRLLSTLCQCENKIANSLPTGVKLLSYLYEKTLEATPSLHYPMFLSLFHASCGPYIMFVREWVFQGHCHDLYGEFMIHVNEDYLQFRDRHYWTHGYVLAAGNIEDTVPPFLRDLANDIFTCGKSINLLRLISPRHFLLGLETETPPVSICFSEVDVRSIEQQCRTYRSRMQEVARQHAKAREELIREKEQAKQDVLIKARRTALEQIAKFQERAEAIRKAQDEKKRAAFAELKANMEKDIQRRANMKEKEKEEDAARSAAANRQELLEASVEEELAKKAREELIREYEEMTAVVAHREQRALWRVARHRLETRRIEFLAKDEQKWQTELAENPFIPQFNDEVLDEAVKIVSENYIQESDVSGTDEPDISVPSDTFPGETSPTTQDQIDFDTTNATSSEDIPAVVSQSDETLPSWARDGTKTALAPFRLEEIDKAKIPSLARETTDEVPLLKENKREGATEHLDGRKDDTDTGKISDTDEGKPRRLRMTTWAAARVRASLSQDDSYSIEPISSPLVPSTDNTGTPKSSVRMSSSMSATRQSDEGPICTIPQRKSVGQAHISQQTKYDGTLAGSIPHRKSVDHAHIGQETTEDITPKGVRKRSSMSSTMQSIEEVNPIQKRKTIEGQHIGQQSQQEVNTTLKIKFSKDRHASKQSEPSPHWVVKQSKFGHPSQLSMISNYELIKPAIKMVREPSVLDNADFGDFLVKGRKRVRVSDDEVDSRPMIGMNRDRYATKESEYIDYNKIKTEKFKQLNIHGHASDSSVQRLLYGENFGRGRISRVASLQEEHENYDIEPWTEIEMEEYNTELDMLDDIPMVDLMNSMGADTGFLSWGDYSMSLQSDVSAYDYISLHSLTKRSITMPLATQIQLVNQSLINYFVGEMEIDSHFEALRRFLLMEDGEFGQSLSDQLFEKLAQNPMPHEMLNPMYLNNVLSRSLRSSIHGDSEYARLVSFALKYIPKVLNHHAPNALDCVELTYKVDWPVNIVVTESGLNKYCRVFSFMLQLKRAVWVLKDVWHRLKRDAIINKASTSAQFKRLQLCRHEMQHFVKVMQGYIANQVIHVTWKEFQDDMSRNIVSLDDLHRCHSTYLDKCVCRCLLSKEAGPVMKIIKEIFKLILKFRQQLILHEWLQEEDGIMSHPAYDAMCHDYKVFKDYSRFLFKVVSRLAMRGYQPHLQELLLRLNFNSYYSDQ